jgi:uncharacterized protein YdeI (YjbR/CyaY-like superfamily)
MPPRKPVTRRTASTRAGLRRARNPIPASVKKALTQGGLMERYQERPAYQQNDYVGWISRAKLEETRQKRLRQMLQELRQGTHYMNMAWRPRRPL